MNTRRGLLVVLASLALAASAAPAAERAHPGYVDAEIFRQIAGDDAITVEISNGKPLLRIFGKGDDELSRMLAALESIRAVILDLSELPDREAKSRRAVKAIEDTDRRLRAGGWERVAMVREGDETVRVLVLPRDDLLLGLVVLITDGDEIVFTNIAGLIDLARIEAIADQFDLPGLDEIEIKRDDD